MNDKYRFAKWGKVKIAQALQLKKISYNTCRQFLNEIDEEEYEKGLRDLLRQKSKSVSGRNEYERNTKLIRFAVGRGFTMNEVLRYVKQADPDELMD